MESFDLSPNGSSFYFNNSNNSVPIGNITGNITIKQNINVTDKNDNFFADFWKSVEAVYFWTTGRWDQVDQWDFWPVDLLTMGE